MHQHLPLHVYPRADLAPRASKIASEPAQEGLFDRVPFVHSFNKSIGNGVSLTTLATSQALKPVGAVASHSSSHTRSMARVSPLEKWGHESWWSLADMRPADGELKLQQSYEHAVQCLELSIEPLPSAVSQKRLNVRDSVLLAPDSVLEQARQRAAEAVAMRAKWVTYEFPV